MTPEERDLVRGLFDRLTRLEREPRDAEAERLIRDGLTRAPNAVYALVQSVLIQEEALRLANERIEQLEADLAEATPPAPSNGSFLGNRRGATVPPSGGGKWNTGAVLGGGPAEPPPGPGPGPRGDRPMGLPPSFGGARGRGEDPYADGYRDGPMGGRGGPMGGPMDGTGGGPAGPGGAGPSRGGGFLGTAAAAAVGVIGGSILMGGLKSALGGQGGGNAAGGGTGGGEAKSPFADVFDKLAGDNKSSSGSGGGSGDLSREAGLGDIGSRQGASSAASSQAQEAGDDFDDDNYGEGGDEDYDDADFDDDNYGDDEH